MASSQIISLKTEVARHRCEALAREIRRLKSKEFSSRGSTRLIKFVETGTKTVLDYLQAEENLPDRDLLKEEELDDRIHRATKLIPFLHYLLGFIEGSEMGSVPLPLVTQLGGFANSVIPGSELVVTTRPELNYSILEIASWVRAVLNPTPLKTCCDILPQSLFVITIPRVESGEILLHCILSHELGHGLYRAQKLDAKILPKVQIDQESVKGLASTLISQMPGQAPPLFEVELRNVITQQVTGRISRWVQELCSDAFGLLLFGPAYYFSFIYFSLAFAHLDKETKTHPPPRLRLKLMTRILRRLYGNTHFKPPVADFIRYWESQSTKPIPVRDGIAKMAVSSLDLPTIFESIDSETHACVDPAKLYGADRYTEDLSKLEPLLLDAIPPGETWGDGRNLPNTLPSILNAGWDVLLSGLPALAANLPAAEAGSPYDLRRKLQSFLIKALEISETRSSWEEKRRGAGL